jgi:hypothetical protein
MSALFVFVGGWCGLVNVNVDPDPGVGVGADVRRVGVGGRSSSNEPETSYWRRILPI